MYRMAQRSAAWMGCSVLLLGPVPLPPRSTRHHPLMSRLLQPFKNHLPLFPQMT